MQLPAATPPMIGWNCNIWGYKNRRVLEQFHRELADS
jgi:hypothetical protein